MVTIWDKLIALRRGRMDLPEQVQVEADCLGAAIEAAARIYAIPIRPAWADDKYFIVGAEPSQDQADLRPRHREQFVPRLPRRASIRPEQDRQLVGRGNTDIHVKRGGEVICPKQNLEFPLRDGDVVVFDMLVC